MSGWQAAPMREIVRSADRWEAPLAGTCYRQMGVRLWGEGAYERETIDGSGTKYAMLNRVESGDLVVNKIWARNGSVAVVPHALSGCYVSGEFPTFAPIPSKVDSRWLHWLTKTKPFWDQCDEKSRGTSGKNRIRPEQFLSVAVPLPPIEEQRRIVGRIEVLAGNCGLARQLRVAADLQTASILDSHLEALFREGHQRGWKQYLLGDFVTEARYGTSEKTSDDLSGTPVLRMGNIQNGELVTSDLKYLHLSEAEKVALLLKPGDIVVNRTNSAELVGKCAVFRLAGEYAYASYLIRLRIDTKRAIPELLAAYINSRAGRAYMFAERKQMTGQANVNAQKLKMLPIRLPGLDEQGELLKGTERVRSLAKRIRAEQHLVGLELGAILPSILNQAFSGQF